MILYLLEGLALIIFGIRFLRKGLDRLFGAKLSSWLATMTENRWHAFGAGVAAGAVAPSSTALSVLSMQLVRDGRLESSKMLAVLLGGGVGMTITAQLLATGITNEAGYLLIIGVVGFQMLRRDTFRGVGQCLLALGFLFLGLHEIGHGAAVLSEDPQARQFVSWALADPLLVVGATALIAVVLQSSTATIGLALGLQAGGLFPAAALVPWVLGTNLGVSLTSLIVGWSSLEGRRLGAASFIARAVVAMPLFCGAIPVAVWAATLLRSPEHELVALHTGFNLVVGLLAVAMLGPITRLVHWLIVAAPDEAIASREEFLEENALASPAQALAQATRQMLVMADRIDTMLKLYWAAETTRNTDLAEKVQRQDDAIDHMHGAISTYLSRIGGEDMSPDDTKWQFSLLAFSNELESVGDIIDKHLCDSVRKRAADLVVFSPAELGVLGQVHDRVAERLRIGIGFLSWRDASSAQKFLEGKETFNDWCRLLEAEHFQRLRSRESATLSSSAYFLDVLNSFRRINSHISSIAYAF